MNFKDIEFKIFKSNIKRYRLYFISNIIATAIFYAYAAIFTNDEFMDENIVDSIISSNIGAPSVFVAVFILFFIPYSYNAFNKFRKRDFGIFLSIGMSEKDIRKIMIKENIVIELVSLIIGLILGTILSKAFYLFAIKILKMTGLHIMFNLKSYLVTIILFLGAYILTLIAEVISELKYTAIDFLKFNKKSDEGMKGNIIILALGFIIISCAIILAFFDYDHSENNILISIAVLFVGVYIVFLNLMSFIFFFKKRFRKTYYKNLIFISNLKHDFNKVKKVVVMMMLLIAFSEFMLTIAIRGGSIILRDIPEYNPYDIEYVSVFDKNQLEQSKINEIMNSGDTSLLEEKEVDFLRNGLFVIFPVSELNRECDRNYSVEEGKFILFFLYDMNDGYNHDQEVNVNIPKVSVQGKNQNLELSFQEKNIDIIFGDVYAFPLYKIIVSDEDYKKIKEDNVEYKEGTLHLFSFEDWSKTGSIVNNLKYELTQRNDISDVRAARFFKANSRIENYNNAKNSKAFLIITMTFMSMLLVLAANIMMHFKLVMDLENEKEYYNNLCKIGMTYRELESIIDKKLRLVFLVPAVVASVISFFYSYRINVLSKLIDKGVIYSFFVSLTVLTIQVIIYIFYKRYFKKLVYSQV